MNILSISTCSRWSWTLTAPYLYAQLAPHTVRARYAKDLAVHDFANIDSILVQNVDGLKYVPAEWLPRTLVRLGGLVVKNKEQLQHTAYDALLAQVGAIFSTNKELLEHVALRCNANSHLVPNSLDLTKFTPQSLKVSRTENFRVGFAGNIQTSFAMQYKGYPLIVNAVNSLFDTTELITALFGRDRQIPHEEMIAKFYSRIHCLVSASENEGCSNVIMEALACGVPVICTKVGYHGETLTDGENCLFIERSAKSIAQAITRLRINPILYQRLQTNGPKFAKAHHDVVDVVNIYRKVFNQL